MGSTPWFWQRIPAQRRKRIVLFAAAATTVGATLWAARSVLGLYMIGLLLAYILAPLVGAIQRGIEWTARKVHLRFLGRAARSLAILLSYLLVVGLIAGFIALVVPIVSREAQQLWAARDAIWGQLTEWWEDVFARYQLLPDRVQMQIDDALRDLSTFITTAFQQALKGSVTAISYTTSLVLGATIVPFWTYFLLRDYAQLRRSLHDSLPDAIQSDVRSVAKMLDRTIGAYLRGQILLMAIMGVLQTIVLTIVGVDYALLLGVLTGLLEIVPSIGPTLAAVPAVLIALADSPGLALLTAGAAVLVQQVENSFIVPRVLGRTIGLHPVVMMVMLVVGTEIAGLPGLVLAPILTAVLRDVYRYLAFRFADEPQTPERALDLAMERGAPPVKV
ncbi:MAG: AI-2E family transporter [Anaerolineae bacterium]|nr:AI-2E family transporter [Anaerolineae bacterium]